MKLLLVFLLLLSITKSFSQSSYQDSITSYIKNYVDKHEVVLAKDKKHLHFYPVDENFRIKGRFEKVDNSPWFIMTSSGVSKHMYRIYGKVHFNLHDTAITLNIYQSQDLMQMTQYKDDLFIPFTDATSGIETYEGGRYFDFTINDIKANTLIIDFNKAYNPYCAYVSNVYSCPIPPRENNLSVAIKAGEKAYDKAH